MAWRVAWPPRAIAAGAVHLVPDFPRRRGHSSLRAPPTLQKDLAGSLLCTSGRAICNGVKSKHMTSKDQKVDAQIVYSKGLDVGAHNAAAF